MTALVEAVLGIFTTNQEVSGGSRKPLPAAPHSSPPRRQSSQATAKLEASEKLVADTKDF